MAIHEPRRREGVLRGFEIAATQEDIDVLSIPDRRFVHTRNPGRQRIPSHDRVGNLCLLQCSCSAKQPNAHFLHGPDHSFQGDLADRRLALAQAHCFSRL
jgi:hypothetical protein